jgi:hypothetical protein
MNDYTARMLTQDKARELRERIARPRRSTRRRAQAAAPPIDEAIAALEKARDLPEFQRLMEYQQILNAYWLSGR